MLSILQKHIMKRNITGIASGPHNGKSFFFPLCTLSLFPSQILTDERWKTTPPVLTLADVTLPVVYNYWKKSLDPEQTLIAAFPNENKSQMLAGTERVFVSLSGCFFNVFKDSQSAAKTKLWPGEAPDKSSSELLPSCQQTCDPWKVIREVNMSQIADNGKGMMIIYKVTAYLHQAASAL